MDLFIKNIKSTLTVDDLDIKYDNKTDVEHVFHALCDKYTISTDWIGRHFCGLTIDFNYKERYVDISMPN